MTRKFKILNGFILICSIVVIISFILLKMWLYVIVIALLTIPIIYLLVRNLRG